MDVDTIGFGDLEMEVLWPPADAAAVTDDDPNSHSIVGLLEWRRFRMLLTGDAEAGMAPLDPGPLDVLKVAHHGAALTTGQAMIEQARPAAAVISVGVNNYGHPDPGVLERLADQGCLVFSTRTCGAIRFDCRSNQLTVRTMAGGQP